MLTSSIQAQITANIDTGLKRLMSYSTHKGIPPTNSEQETVAGEYWLTDEVVRKVASARKIIQREAILHGVILDTDIEQRLPGTNIELFSGEHFASRVKVNNPSATFDKTKAVISLRRQGVDEKIITQMLKDATGESKAPHIFSVTPRLSNLPPATNLAIPEVLPTKTTRRSYIKSPG